MIVDTSATLDQVAMRVWENRRINIGIAGNDKAKFLMHPWTSLLKEAAEGNVYSKFLMESHMATCKEVLDAKDEITREKIAAMMQNHVDGKVSPA